MYDDMIRISESFEGCQLSIYIAESDTSALKSENYNIINFGGT
jgi:hypothetical protein